MIVLVVEEDLGIFWADLFTTERPSREQLWKLKVLCKWDSFKAVKWRHGMK